MFQVSVSRADIEEQEENAAQKLPEDGLFDMVATLMVRGGRGLRLWV